MRSFCILFMVMIVLISCRNPKPSFFYYVEDFRSLGMTDDEVIQEAIDAAGQGDIIQFEPNGYYLIENAILVKQSQSLIGNNATLRRADQTFTTLKSPVPANSDTVVVNSVPDGWKRGDQLQVFTDSTTGNSNGFGDYRELPNIITSIHNNIIILSSPVGKPLNEKFNTWPAGAKVRKVYTILRGDSINMKSVAFSVSNMNFDGNKKNNELNFYWNVNSTIFMRGMGGKIEDCRFWDIPNETIVGQGMLVTNCQARDLNGSFVHLAGNDTMRNLPNKNAMIIANTVIGVCQVSTYVTGHSEGIITLSYNGGFATVANNRFYNSGEAAIGTIDGHLAVDDAGKSEFIITGNLFKNCKRIIHKITYAPQGSTLPTDIFISNNVFSKCGDNDWSKSPYKDGHSGLKMGVNSFTNNTTWKMPESELK